MTLTSSLHEQLAVFVDIDRITRAVRLPRDRAAERLARRPILLNRPALDSDQMKKLGGPETADSGMPVLAWVLLKESAHPLWSLRPPQIDPDARNDKSARSFDQDPPHLQMIDQ